MKELYSHFISAKIYFRYTMFDIKPIINAGGMIFLINNSSVLLATQGSFNSQRLLINLIKL